MSPRSLARWSACWLLCSSACARQDAALAPTAAERAWLEAHPVVRLAPAPDYAPLEWIDADGRLRGLTAELVERLEPLLGVRFEVCRLSPEERQRAGAEAVGADLTLLSARTPEREARWLFGAPWLELPAMVLSREDRPELGSLADLAGARVAVVGDHAAAEHLRRSRPELELVPVADGASGLVDLALGDVDAFVTELAVAGADARRLGVLGLRLVGPAGYTYRLGFAVRRDWPELASLLTKAFAALPPAELEALRARWLDPFTAADPAARRASPWQLAAFAALTLSLALLLSCGLRARRRRRAEIAGSLASGVAHDIGNLLTVIRGQAELLERDRLTVDTLRPVVEAADRAAALTRRLATLGAPSAATSEEIDLGAFLHEREGLLRAAVGRRARLELVLCDEALLARLDPLELEEILFNLALNAREALAERGTLRITLRRFARGNAEIVVEDDGAGMSAETRRRVLSQAWTSKGQGHGVGLAHVRHLVRRNRGQIACLSELGVGTSFTLRFPLANESGLLSLC